MAASKQSKGYKCEFLDSVPDDFYCKKCTLVARKLVMTDCCVESYCHGCIADSLDQGQPCPACGEHNFTIFHQKKYHKRIDALKVCCSMKERGCVWSGTLDQLDAHLDPDLDNCQYVDTKCPLNCLLTVPKNKMEQHVAQECVRRPHVCQHCGFKATYQEVVDTHLPQCKYVPLTCPNLCGVSCERDFLEDHMKTCRLEEIHCGFRSVGCDDRFIREDEDEHTRENSHKNLALTAKHLTLTASLAVQNKEQLLQKLLEQDKKHKEVETEMKEKLQQQEKTIELQKKTLELQENKIMQQEMKLEQQQKKLNQQQQTLNKQQQTFNKQQQMFHQREEHYKMQNLQLINDLKEVKQKLMEQEIDTKKWLKEVQKQNKEECRVENEKHLRMFEKQERKLEELQDLYKKTTSTLLELKSASEQKATLIKNEVSDLSQTLNLKHTFDMENFSIEKKKDRPGDWKSPAMYTHVCGYKFCIGVDANGHGGGRGKSVNVRLLAMPGEYDYLLKWPAKVEITLELLNQRGGQNAVCTVSIEYTKPTACESKHSFNRVTIKTEKLEKITPSQSTRYRLQMLFAPGAFLHHSELPSFLTNDTLHFNINKIQLF